MILHASVAVASQAELMLETLSPFSGSVWGVLVIQSPVSFWSQKHAVTLQKLQLNSYSELPKITLTDF